jgi:hypothetical protein
MKKLLVIFGLLLWTSTALAQTTNTIDLLWEADTSTPVWYEGKALASPDSSVRVVALPFFQAKNGTRLASEQLTFDWRKDGRPLPSVSGVGRSSLTYTAGGVGTAANIEVTITYPAESLALRQSVLIPVVAPEVRLYEAEPLWGPLTNLVLPTNLRVAKPEIAVTAAPFFFSNDAVRQNNLTYRWRLNGQPIVTDSQNPATLNFLAPTDNPGFENIIDLSVAHPRLGSQIATANFHLTFDSASPTIGSFGWLERGIDQLAALWASAQEGPAGEGPRIGNDVPTPGTSPSPVTDPNGFQKYLSDLFSKLISVIAVLAVLTIAYWGLKYILSGIPGIKTVSKERIWLAFWGLILALSAWLILDTINPQINETLKDWLKALQ